MVIEIVFFNTEKNVVGFHLDVENGSIPDDGKCNQRKGISTRVVLVCNPSVKWTNQDLGSNLHIVHTEFPNSCEVSRTVIMCSILYPMPDQPSTRSLILGECTCCEFHGTDVQYELKFTSRTSIVGGPQISGCVIEMME